MKLGQGAHLTYCTNIHAGESWAEIRANLEAHVLAVKRRVSPDRPFGVGLRLGARAAEELARPEALADLRALLAREGLYVFTINAFPYGPFHRTVVKEEVYRPDWLEPERLRYSNQVAGILDGLLAPERPGTAPPTGSISTVPGCFRPRATEPAAGARIGEQLARHAATLWRIAEAGGAHLGLALEPEPECLFETTAQGIAFLEEQVFSAAGRAAFTHGAGVSPSAAEEALRRHVGLCLDACHAAVEFEEPEAAVAAPRAAGIRIFKLQVSAGLRVPRADAGRRQALARFAEGVYLHQVVIRRGATLERVLDLPAALARSPVDPDEEWRIHFHVPIFRESLGPFASTQSFLSALLAIQARTPFTEHLEVETYTWDVLPEEHRGEPVADAVARELSWALTQLGERTP
jgi:sugar phosphate isomerase/epimerase